MIPRHALPIVVLVGMTSGLALELSGFSKAVSLAASVGLQLAALAVILRFSTR